MWVRSLSLPPPHPLVLTGKGRSFLQPKLPTFPLRTFPVCVLDVSHVIRKWGAVAAFTAEFCGGLVQFLFFVLCGLFSKRGVLLHILYRHSLPGYWSAFIFLQSFACCCASAALGYVHTCDSRYTKHTCTGFTPSLFLHERSLNVTNLACVPGAHHTFNPHARLCPSGALHGLLSCRRLLPTNPAFECVCVCVKVPTYNVCVHVCVFVVLVVIFLLCSSSGEEEVAHGMKVWRKALTEVRSAAQLAMCIQQLQKSIAWERSIMKVVSREEQLMTISTPEIRICLQ